MAFLQNLIVTGSSKFLNKIYATDLDITGTFSTSGNLNVGGTLNVTGVSNLQHIITSGNVTINGGLELSHATPYIDFHFGKSTANYTSRIIEASNGILTISNGMKTASGEITTATITTANISTNNMSTGNAENLNVTNKLHATHFDLQSVAQLGGAFYVSPTIKFPTDNNSAMTITKSGSTLNIVISDSALTSTTLAGVVWGQNAKIKASGKIGTVTTGTMDGTVTSINTTSHTLNISVSGENASSVEAGSYTSAQIDNFCVMMYQTGDGHPVGIMMNSYGTDGRTYIDIHGGTATASTPNVRIGNLGGLSFNGATLSNQWGIYTNNGYYTGSIVANGGKIGGFTIGENAIYTGTITSNADNNIGLSSTDFTRTIGGTSRNGLRFAIGDKTGITGDGILYVHSLQATGGKIGGWNIASDFLYNYSSVTTGTASTQYGFRLCVGTTQTSSIIRVGSRTYDGASTYGAWDNTFYIRNDGYMFSSSGSIGNWNINSTSLSKGTWGTENGIMLHSTGISTAKSIGGSNSISGWTITSGANFGVTKTGAVYCSDLHATGEITATSGYIGSATNGFTIDSSGFYSGTKTANTSGYISLSNSTFSRTINGTATNNLNFAIGSKFGVSSDGTLYANGLNITGINADNITLGTVNIERLTSIKVGGRNFLLGTGETKTVTLTNATGDYYIEYFEESEYGKSITNGNTTEYFTVSFEWSTTSETGVAWIQIDGNIVANVLTVSGNKTNQKSEIDLSQGSGKYVATFRLTQTQAGKASQRMRFRVAGSDTAHTAGSTFTVWNLKFEQGNMATQWSPAPEDTESTISSVRQLADTALSQSIEYIVGTQTASTNLWTGVTKDSSIYVGKTIAYYLPFAGNTSAATLNLTLSNGTTTGAKNVRWNNTNITTHYPQYSIITLTYDGTYWRTGAYNSDTYNRVRLQNNIVAAENITNTHIICGTSSGYRDIGANVSFDLTYPLLYASYAINKGATTGTRDGNFLSLNGVDASKNGTITSGAAGKILYLKGTINNNTFTIASSPFMTTVVPTSTDNYVYLPLGLMYSATNIYFISTDKLYAYKDGAFRELARGEASEASKTAKNYLYYDNTNGLVISSSASSQTYAGASTGYNTRLTNSALEIRNGTNVLASYGSTVTIGKTTEAHQVLDSNSLKFVSNEGETLFEVEDLTSPNGYTSYDFGEIEDASSATVSSISSALANALNNIDASYLCSENGDYVDNANISNTFVKISITGATATNYDIDYYGDFITTSEQNLGVTFATVEDGHLTIGIVTTVGASWENLATELINAKPTGTTFEYIVFTIKIIYPVTGIAMTFGNRDDSSYSKRGIGSVSMGENNLATGRYSYTFGRDLNNPDDYSVIVGEGNGPIINSVTGARQEAAFAVGANGGTPFAVLKNGTIMMSSVNTGRFPDEKKNAYSRTDYTVTFQSEYPSPPFVFFTLCEDNVPNNQNDIIDYGRIQIYLKSVSTTGFTATVVNGSDTAHNFGFNWFAISTYGDSN